MHGAPGELAVTDLATLQAELEDAEEAFAESQALRRRLESQEQLVAGTEAELRAARASLDDERGDVAALESFSPTRIWAALRGTRVADLDREQAEVRAAEYAVARIELRHRELTEDRTRLEGRLPGGSAVLRVRTSRPEAEFALRLGPQVAREPDVPGAVDGTLSLPAEAWLRLVAGRLAPGRTPESVAATGAADLDLLREVFPGY